MAAAGSDGWAPITGTRPHHVVVDGHRRGADQRDVDDRQAPDHNAQSGQLIGVRVKAKNGWCERRRRPDCGGRRPVGALNFAVVGRSHCHVVVATPVELLLAGTPDAGVLPGRASVAIVGRAALTNNLTATSPNLAYGTAYEYQACSATVAATSATVTCPGRGGDAGAARTGVVTEAGSGRATLTWQIPDDEGLAPVTSYCGSIGPSTARTTITTTELASYAYRVRLRSPAD